VQKYSSTTDFTAKQPGSELHQFFMKMRQKISEDWKYPKFKYFNSGIFAFIGAAQQSEK
jgi:hypothetical protein